MKIVFFVHQWVGQNKILVILLALYIGLMVSIITWGIPNQDHPFNYYMDEWHQMQSLRALAKYGSPNVAGAANGTILHFLLSGIYLVPFMAFKIINPFEIKSPLEGLLVQEKLFILLRINTLIFGVMSIVLIYILSKRYLKIHPFIPVFFFIFNPVWLYQSNYFKYDVALVFWILLALLFLFRFAHKPTLKNYLLGGFFSALAPAAKLSALPLFIVYIVSFFYFTKSRKKNFKILTLGVVIFLLTFLVLGIPDLILQKGDIREYLYDNLLRGPASYSNFTLEFSPWWLYLFLKVWPLDLGYSFLAATLTAVLYWITLLAQKGRSILAIYKNVYFLLVAVVIFMVSLFPLKIGASGNRILVLVPFFVLLCGSFFEFYLKKYRYDRKILFVIIFIAFLIIQIFQSILMSIYVKWGSDVRQISSIWLKKNLNQQTVVGIENIPIYQLLPDIILKEYYTKQYNADYKTYFTYKIVDYKTRRLPSIVILTNKELETNYLRDSPKKRLVVRLKKNGYKNVVEFKPPKILYALLGNELSFYTTGIVGIPTISIFSK